MQRVALITGASSGIGWSVAEYLAARDIATVAAARRLERMDPLKERGIFTVRLDVSDSASIDACLATVRREVGEIDILVNNAGVELLGPAELIPMSEGRGLFDVNFFGLVEATQKCLRHMRTQRWGRVVNVSSIGGVASQPFNGWYHASKHAIEGFTKSLRQEMAQFGVSASTIRPGSIRSEVFHSSFEEHDAGTRWDEDFQESVNQTMQFLHRIAQRASDPVHVARVVYRAITDRHPRVSYTAPLHARAMQFCLRYLCTESFGNRVVPMSLGLKDRITRY